MNIIIRPNKKIPVFRVIRPNLNLLVKPILFSGFLEEKYNSIHFERHFAFQMYKIIFFSRNKKIIKKKYVCLPYLKFSDPLPKTLIFFIWP